MTSEFFQINDVILDVLPSDIIQFNNNAVYEESFLRSKATFAFRSKYSNNKIIITQPISMNPLAYKDTVESSNQYKGLKVLHQLSKYPFCFIKSTRVKSYVSSRANISSTGFMMFVVDEINVVQDMSVSDVLFLEYHLVYNDHTSQTPDFKFVSSDGKYEVDNPDESLVFTETFEMGFDKKYNSFISNILSFKNKVDNDQNKNTYGSTSTPYNIVEALVPKVLEQTEFNSSTYEQGLEEIKKKFDYKVVKVTAKNGNNSVSPEFLGDTTGQADDGSSMTDDEESKASNPDMLQTLHVYWTSFHTLSFGGNSSVQSLKLSLKNKLAKLNVGTHKYPVVQYLGRFPARLDIVLNFVSGDVYETDESSVISAVGQLSNSLDYNNDMYPEIGAYNTLKIKSVMTELVGLENFVPNQSSVRASSDNQGQEAVTISFIEADVEDFLKAGNITKGRPSSYDGVAPEELEVVITFITSIANNAGIRSQLESSKNKELYGKAVNLIIQALLAGKNSFTKGVDKDLFTEVVGKANTPVAEQMLKDVQSDKDLNSLITASKISNLSSYTYPNTKSVVTVNSSDIQYARGVPNRTVIVNTVYEPVYFEALVVFLNKWKQGLESIQRVQKDTDAKIYSDSNSLFANNGTVNGLIASAFQTLVSLKEKDEPLAISLINNVKSLSLGTTEYLAEKIRTSYSGTCLPDIPFSELLDPTVDPFFFLSYRNYLTRSQFVALHRMFEEDVFQAFKKSISTSLQTTETDSDLILSGSWSLFTEKGTSLKERWIVADKEGKGVVATGALGDTTYAYLSPTQSKIISRGSSNKYDDIIIKYAQQFNLPAGLVKAVVHTESHFNPNAVSPAGARGLMQLTPPTAKEQGVSNPFDPDQNIKGGAKYLAVCLKRFKKLELALAAYNAGGGNVSKYGGIPPFKETQNYVSRVMRLYNTLYSNGLESAPRVQQASTTGASTTTLTNQAQKALDNKVTTDIKDQLKNKTLFKAQVVPYTRKNKNSGVSKDVSDGDTFAVKYNGKEYIIRPAYYDAPEISHGITKPETPDAKGMYYETEGNPGGEESKRYLNSIMPVNTYVYLRTDPETTNPAFKDVNNRLTSDVILDGSFSSLAEKMIESGNAFVWSKQQSGGGAVLNDLKIKEEIARKENKGVHGSVSVAEIANTKNKLDSLEKELQSALTDSARLDVAKKYADYIKNQQVTIGSQVYKLTSKLTTEEKNKKKEEEKKLKEAVSKVKANNDLSKINYDIHVQGITTTSYSEAKKYMSAEWGSRAIKQDGVVKGYRMHYGIDVSYNRAPSKNVIAAASGVVSTRYFNGGGKVIVIDHGNGFYTRYMHLDSFAVKNLSTVKTGQVIGVIGSTNTGDGKDNGHGQKHLHQETWVDLSGGGSAHLINVHPFKTTSLKTLSGMDPKVVRANIKNYISNPDQDRLLNLEPSKALSVYGVNDQSQNIYVGKEVSQGVVVPSSYKEGSTPNVNTASTTEAMDVADPTGYKSVDRNVADKYSVFYEEENVNHQATVATYHTGLGMKVCLPTFKAYIVIGSEIEDEKIGSSIKSSYYFEIDGLSDIMLACNDDLSPMDVITFKVANPSFINTDLIAIAGKYLTRDFTNVNTSAEVSFASDRLRIQPGTKLHFRMGYGNNPNELETVFNGIITEASNPEGISLSVIAEGYGRELLMDSINKFSPLQLSSADTPTVLSHAMASESIVNFGATVSLAKAFIGTIAVTSDTITGHSYTDPENKRLTTIGLSTNMLEPGNWRQRSLTNLYASEVETVQTSYNTSWFNYLKKLFTYPTSNEMFGYKYILMGQSPWEIMKEMEYRHPGTMVKPLFYQDRMTMFFGYKDQMYIARDLHPQFMSKAGINADETMTEEYIVNRRLRFEPVTKFHLLTTEFNLLTNSLRLNNQFKTTAKISYFDRGSVKQENNTDSMHEYQMKVDDTLMAFETRIGTIDMPGTHSKYSAFMYGTTYLRKQMESMYSGTLTMIGNPHVKAGDFVHLKDSQKRMEGLIKVRQCKHFFSENTGFVTEITPGLYVEPRSFMYSALMLKLSYTARVALSNAKISNSIITNENVDFTTYQDYLDKLSLYAKRPTNWFDHLGWSEYTSLGNMWYQTGGTSIITAAMSTFALYGTARFLMKGATIAKGVGTAFNLVNDARTLGTAFSYLANIKSSQTTLNMLNKAKGLWTTKAVADKGRVAATLFRAGNAFKGTLSAAGAVSWFAGSRALGFISALGTGALATNPAGWLIRIGLMLFFMAANNKMQEAELTRQPLMFFPISYNGKPFVAGIAGYKYDSYYEALKTNFSRNWKTVSKAAYSVEITSNKSLAKSLGTFVQWAGVDAYRKERAEQVKNAFSSIKQQNVTPIGGE